MKCERRIIPKSLTLNQQIQRPLCTLAERPTWHAAICGIRAERSIML